MRDAGPRTTARSAGIVALPGAARHRHGAMARSVSSSAWWPGSSRSGRWSCLGPWRVRPGTSGKAASGTPGP